MVGDDSHKTDLSVALEKPEAKRASHGALQRLPWKALAPIGSREIAVDHIHVQARGVGTDGELAAMLLKRRHAIQGNLHRSNCSARPFGDEGP